MALLKNTKHDTQYYCSGRSLILTRLSGLAALYTSQAGMWISKRRFDTLKMTFQSASGKQGVYEM
jgi:hypothetical protein